MTPPAIPASFRCERGIVTVALNSVLRDQCCADYVDARCRTDLRLRSSVPRQFFWISGSVPPYRHPGGSISQRPMTSTLHVCQGWSSR